MSSIDLDSTRPHSGGYITIEYALVTTGVAVALLLPIPGIGDSMVDMTLAAIRQFQEHTVAMLALP